MVAVGRRALDGSHLDRTRCLRELARGVADDDDQRVRGRKRRCADGPNLASRKPVTKLVRRLGRDERREGRRGVVLIRSREARNPRRDRSVRSGGGNVDAINCLAAELIDARQPPQPVGGRRARRRGGARLDPGSVAGGRRDGLTASLVIFGAYSVAFAIKVFSGPPQRRAVQ